MAEAGSGGQAKGIFSGLKVLEMGSGAAGPVATRYLAEHGATVVRIESAKRPDFLRVLWLTPDSKFGLDGSPMFIFLNPNKLSCAINMKKPEGIALAKRLVRWADVLCENFAPGPMGRWGMDYESLRELNPGLVMVSGCLFGQTGPHRTYPGFGAQGSALSGFNHLTGWPDRASQGPLGTITDSLSPRFVALAIVGALLERRRTGEGHFVDISQIEAAVYGLSEIIVRYGANGEIIERSGNAHEHAAPHSVYPCRGEDRWIAIAVFSDEAWQALRAQMGDPAWARDERFATQAGRKANEAELDREIAAWTRDFDAHELMARLQQAGVEAGAVQSFGDLLEDPQLAHRRHFMPLEHCHLGKMEFERSALRFSESQGGYHAPGPNIGAHTRAVLEEMLGLSPAEIEALEKDEVLV